MSGEINVEKKINIFTVKLANNKKFIITVYDNDIIISTLINNIFNNSIAPINKSNNIDIVYKINEKLLNNLIENNCYRLQRGNICDFEVIPETIIIEENKINSIVKIINNTKLVITVFDDNIFITFITKTNKDNYYSFYYDNNRDIFHTMDIVLSRVRSDFSHTQKNVLSKHDSALYKIL